MPNSSNISLKSWFPSNGQSKAFFVLFKSKFSDVQPSSTEISEMKQIVSFFPSLKKLFHPANNILSDYQLAPSFPNLFLSLAIWTKVLKHKCFVSQGAYKDTLEISRSPNAEFLSSVLSRLCPHDGCIRLISLKFTNKRVSETGPYTGHKISNTNVTGCFCPET